MHLGRPSLPHLPPCRQTADISAARNCNNPGYILSCTYIIVIKVFLQEHFVTNRRCVPAGTFVQPNTGLPRPDAPGPPDSRGRLSPHVPILPTRARPHTSLGYNCWVTQQPSRSSHGDSEDRQDLAQWQAH